MTNRIIKLSNGRKLDGFTCARDICVEMAVRRVMSTLDFANRSDFTLEAAYCGLRYVRSGGKITPRPLLYGFYDHFITAWHEVGDFVNTTVLTLMYAKTKIDINKCREEENGFYHNEKLLLDNLERFIFEKPELPEPVESVIINHILDTISQHDHDQRERG